MVEMEAMEEDDKQEVKTMIERHLEYTGSVPAKHILDNWETSSDMFVKIMPRDYKVVMLKMREKMGLKEATVA